MTLALILENPRRGIVAAAVTRGTLDCRLDRYPRWSLSADIRPNLSNGVRLEESPYGTRATVLQPDGSLLFRGYVHEARGIRPDGQWTLTAADPIILFSQYRFSGMPGQHLPGTTMSVPEFIRAMALRIGIAATVEGSGGTVDVTALDLAGKDAWRAIEEQLIANTLDVYPQPDGTLLVGPTAAMKPDGSASDVVLKVGQQGTVTSWNVTMRRRVNRVVVAHQAQKDGQPDRWLEGVWEDHAVPSGIDDVGPVVYTETVRVGASWWDDLPGHQAQANANAAAIGQTLRGIAREAAIEAIPDYSVRVGMTADVEFTGVSSDRFLVAAVSWPLEPGAMTVTGRNPDPGRRQGAARFYAPFDLDEEA